MAFRSAVATTFEDTGTLAASMPAGVAANDRLIAIVSQDSSGRIIAPPAGWEATPLLTQNLDGPDGQSVRVFEKRQASGSEGATQTFTSDGTNRAHIAILAFSGRHNSAAVTFANSAENESSNTSPISASTASGTAVAGDDICLLGAVDVLGENDVWGWAGGTWASGHTERIDAAYNWCGIAAATQDAVSAGAYGTVTATITRSSGSSNAGWFLGVVAIPVAAGGASSVPKKLQLING